MEIKHHFISANINFNAVLLFNSTTERHLETSNLIIFNIDYPSMKASLIAQLVKNLPVMQKILVRFLGQEDLLEKGQATHSRILGSPLCCGSAGKEPACNAEDPGSIPGSGRSPGEGTGYPLQHSGLENPMDYTVHGVAESDRSERLSLSPFCEVGYA